jgi:hypothetical protein
VRTITERGTMSGKIVIVKEDFDVDPVTYAVNKGPITTSSTSVVSKITSKGGPKSRKKSSNTPLSVKVDSSLYSKFKHLENQYFEFKESTNPKGFQKYIETLCGFLNTGEGGYLIFGISDDLSMIGLQSRSEKDIDSFICRIDSITSTGLLLQQTSAPSSSSPENSVDPPSPLTVCKITPNTLRTTLYVNNVQQRFLVVDATPTKGVKYQCADGMIFYRLGASNYFEKVERLFRQSEYETAVKRIETNANNDNKRNIELFSKTLTEKNQKIEELEVEMKRMSSQLNESNQLTSIYQTHLKQALLNLLSSSSSSSTNCDNDALQMSTLGEKGAQVFEKVYQGVVGLFENCFNVADQNEHYS